jgi:hypothetical protein
MMEHNSSDGESPEAKSNIIQFPISDNSMFTITANDFDGSTPAQQNYGDADFSEISAFKKQAETDGYSSEYVEAAAKLANSTTRSYTDFEKLIDQAMDDAERREQEAIERQMRIRKSIQMEIGKLSKLDNIAQYADNLIYHVYQTTAVTIMDIVKHATPEELQLNIFKEPVYSVIIQINKEWVANKVAEILAGWETNQYPKEFIENYLRSQNVPDNLFEKNKANLIQVLPVTIQSEKSPDTYKQFRAVQLILQAKNPEESIVIANDILSQPIQNCEYSAVLEKEMEDGMPSLAAQAKATQCSIETLPDSMKSKLSTVGLVGTAGAFCGKVINMKYKAAKTFDDMLYESMGQYGDMWRANREVSKQRKEELKNLKAEIKHREAIENLENQSMNRAFERDQRNYYKDLQRAEELEQRKNANLDKRNQVKSKPVIKDNKESAEARDFAPDIPIPVIIGTVNSLLGFFTWLLLGGMIGIVCVVGLGIAFIGFIKKEHGEDKALLTIAGGYALYAIALIFNFM